MARLNRSYAPQDLSGQGDWFQNWTDVMQIVGASVGFAPAELDRIKDDNNVVQFVVTSATTMANYDDGVRGYRVGMLEGDIGSPAPTHPANIALVPPVVVPPGIWARCNADVARVKGMPAYNEAMGETLGIIGIGGQQIAEEDVKPTIDLSAAMHFYEFSCVVSGRYDADMWQLWAKPSGIESFSLLGTATGKSADFTFAPGGDVPAPQALQVYVQLRRNNANYGQPSDIALVTVNP